MNALKQDIKKLSEEQKFLKDQRKSIYNKTVRTMPTWEADLKHQHNRINLRIMYAAWGLMRGKTFEQIENMYPENDHPLWKYYEDISRVIEQYAEKVVHISE